ncbi:MAG: hypothetical protein LBC12_00105 [Nitrososphaerota archaeon]|nr:hypothetical protein [Nitrososphaerota archaeon]
MIFFLYQDSVGCLVSEGFLFQGVGYQGILKLHKNGEASEKKSKGGVLSVVETVEIGVFFVSVFLLRMLLPGLRCLRFWQTSIVTGVNVTNYVQH